MLKLENINKTFGQADLFSHFNLHIKEHDKVLLIAPSGSGKTTLLRLILGFEHPDKGTIYFNDLELNKDSIKSIRSSISYVSQDSDLPVGNLLELLETIFNYKVNRHITNYIILFNNLASIFHLSKDILTKNVQDLSGGERQRVALIIAFILNRPFIILDEITSGLDYKLKCIIRDYVLSQNKTILIVSHDIIWRSNPAIQEVYINDMA